MIINFFHSNNNHHFYKIIYIIFIRIYSKCITKDLLRDSFVYKILYIKKVIQQAESLFYWVSTRKTNFRNNRSIQAFPEQKHHLKYLFFQDHP